MTVSFGKVAFAALVIVGIAACESKEAKHEREARAAADSFAALRKKGVVDLSNPEMGWKVLIRLWDDSVELSHPKITPGQVTFAVENHGTTARSVEIKGVHGDWKTMPIRPKENVLMAMVMDSGKYDIFCPDTTKAHTTSCGASKFISVRYAPPKQGAPTSVFPQPNDSAKPAPKK